MKKFDSHSYEKLISAENLSQALTASTLPSQRDIFAVMNALTSSIRRCHSKQQNPRSGTSPQSNEEKAPASIVICISLMPATGLKKI